MRISDWSSDVCSSDLAALASVASSDGVNDVWTRMTAQSFIPVDARDVDANQFYVRQVGLAQLDLEGQLAGGLDRKSVVEGKSVAVRVDPGGRRIIIKKKRIANNT